MANPHPIPFKKTGADANPNGRPKREWTWAGLIEDAMEKLGPDKKAVKEAVVASLLTKALEGDVVAIKEVGNRIDGLPKQFIDHTTNGKDLPTPLLQGIVDVPTNDSSTEDNQAQ